MALIRAADAPIAAGTSPAWLAARAGWRRGPRLDLGPGWEPDWTFSEIPAAARPEAPAAPPEGGR